MPIQKLKEIQEMPSASPQPRLDGLDVARFLAFFGMVIVNFKIAMGAEGVSVGWLAVFTRALEGRAAATFVVLAGIGLGLAESRSKNQQLLVVTLRRALFLLGIGLLNSLIFDADILHYYAFYFLFGVFCLRMSSRYLVATIILLNLLFVLLIVTLDYDLGWNWQNYTYADFWTPGGFIRNLFFNGWHPVIPWLGFLLFGMILSRLQLDRTTTQNLMIVAGLVVIVAVESGSAWLIAQLNADEIELVAILGTSPIPPMPFYMLAGMGFSAIIIAFCLKIAGLLKNSKILQLILPAGRQTLTLYIAHILIGMGTLQALNMLGGQTLSIAFFSASLFTLFALIFAWGWAQYFRRGAIEMLMRKISG